MHELFDEYVLIVLEQNHIMGVMGDMLRFKSFSGVLKLVTELKNNMI